MLDVHAVTFSIFEERGTVGVEGGDEKGKDV
jgi:hypothetical protein